MGAARVVGAFLNGRVSGEAMSAASFVLLATPAVLLARELALMSRENGTLLVGPGTPTFFYPAAIA